MSEGIQCRPTSWFTIRAGLMLAMFGTFAVLFLWDGYSGYREKNHAFYANRTLERVLSEAAAWPESKGAEGWREHAKAQKMDFPEDRDIFPRDLNLPMPWPGFLQDYAKVRAAVGQQGELFKEYQKAVGLGKAAPEQELNEQKILEQWIFGGLCVALTLGTLVVLVRTKSRRMAIDDTGLYPPGSGRIAFGDLTRLDLRKWDRKGLAFVWARSGGSEEKRYRLDGLTYGGFQASDGQPAEELMKRLRANFRGELIEYVTEDQTEPEPSTPEA